MAVGERTTGRGDEGAGPEGAGLREKKRGEEEEAREPVGDAKEEEEGGGGGCRTVLPSISAPPVPLDVDEAAHGSGGGEEVEGEAAEEVDGFAGSGGSCGCVCWALLRPVGRRCVEG